MSEREGSQRERGATTVGGPEGRGPANREERALTGHAPPFFCPYCGEEDIRPFGDRHGEWVCGSCRRAWALRGIRAGERPAADAPAATTEAAP